MSVKGIRSKITKVFEEQVGLSLTRYELLMILKERQPCLQTEIQEHLKIDSGAVTRHLKILEEKQYVTRQRNPENNREVLVHLTEKAQQELQQCTAKQQTVTEIIPSTFKGRLSPVKRTFDKTRSKHYNERGMIE